MMFQLDRVTKPRNQCLDEVLAGSRLKIVDDVADCLVLFTSCKKNTQPVRVVKCNMGVAGCNLFPELPHSKIAITDVDIMKKNYARSRQFRQPCLEIVFHCLVSVEAVNMKQINRAVAEMLQSLIEGHAQQR